MVLSRVRLSKLASTLATAAVLVTAGLAAAAPPPGMRWSDQAFGPSWASRTTPTPYYTGPSYSYSAPAVVSAPVVTAPAAVATAPATTPAAATIAIRGPDGVVRNYPVQSGTTTAQGQVAIPGQTSTPSYVYLLGSDGVVRPYPVVDGGATAAPGQATTADPCQQPAK